MVNIQQPYIYSLNCPYTGSPMYIGASRQTKNKRFLHHIHHIEKTKKCIWIKSLLDKGLKPIMEIVEYVDKAEMDFWEMHYISLYRSWGFDLKNTKIGGKGRLGYVVSISKETREKIRLAKIGVSINKGRVSPQKGVVMSEETKRKIGAANKGKTSWSKGIPKTEEEKRKIGDGNRGKVRSEESKMKISLSVKKYFAERKLKQQQNG